MRARRGLGMWDLRRVVNFLVIIFAISLTVFLPLACSPSDDGGGSVVAPKETVSTPSITAGASDTQVGKTESYFSGGASSSADHPLQHQFDWGDGNISVWGTTPRSYVWATEGSDTVKVRARCSIHVSIISSWSSGKLVVVANDPPQCVVSDTLINFGLVRINECDERSFTITNTGGGTVTDSLTEACSHYSILLADTILVGSGSYSLGPGESLEVGVRFAPTSSGTETCTIDTGSSCSDVVCTGDGQVSAEYIVHLGLDKTWTTFWNYGACDSGGTGGGGGASCRDTTPIGVADAWIDTTDAVSAAYWASVEVGKEFEVRATCSSGVSTTAIIRVSCEYDGSLSGDGDEGSARALLKVVVKRLDSTMWETTVFDERKSITTGDFPLMGTGTKSFLIPLVAGGSYRACVSLATEAEVDDGAGTWKSNFSEAGSPPKQVKITQVEVEF